MAGNAIVEYRGVEGLVYAEVTTDDAETYAAGTVKPLAGVAEISKTVESSSEAHYYDNIPAVVVASEGPDEITCGVSAIPLEVLAELTGKTFDNTTGALIDHPATSKYFALGYKTQKTDGTEMYVWRLKGKFSIPEDTHSTKNDGTEANGQEIVYTGIATAHKFAKGGSCKGLVVDGGLDKANLSSFFTTVTTPDTLQAKVG